MRAINVDGSTRNPSRTMIMYCIPHQLLKYVPVPWGYLDHGLTHLLLGPCFRHGVTVAIVIVVVSFWQRGGDSSAVRASWYFVESAGSELPASERRYVPRRRDVRKRHWQGVVESLSRPQACARSLKFAYGAA
jgi:hypothetical protein